MCLEDLRIAKGQVAGQKVCTGAGVNLAFPANPSRVGLLICLRGTSGYDSSGGSVFMDVLELTFDITAGARPDLIVTAPCPPVMLRVEDIGSLITRPVSFAIANGSGNQFVTITEILSNVNAPPIP